MSHRVTLYDVLGVRPDASDNEIRAAFRRLTLQHHPDRQQGEARRAAEERFQAITEAFNVLSRPTAREKYDQQLLQSGGGGGGSGVDAKELSRRLAARGAQALKEGRFEEAHSDLAMAVNHDDENFKAHYFLGLTLARLKGRTRDALRHMDRAVQLEPNNSTIKAGAAQLFLEAGMKARAQRVAEECLALDPSNAKAQEIVNQVAGSNEPASGDGLLTRLWRKG